MRIEAVGFVPPADPAVPRNAFTIDVEDWYQSCVDYDAPITDRVVHNVERVLAVLDEVGVKATFFVQGRVAETFPRLVRSLASYGHEVQSHGYSHRPLYAMDRAQLREELERAKATVEEAAGTAVTMFRAQDFSVLARNLWALEVVAETGFEVDSSIFPMRSRHYGIPNWPLEPHHVVLEGGVRLLEVPVAIWSRGSIRFPVAGGGYLRVFPLRVIESGIRSIAAAGRPAVVYCHPYEFNAHELDEYPLVSRRLRLSQGLRRRGFEERIRALLPELNFGTLSRVLEAWGVR